MAHASLLAEEPSPGPSCESAHARKSAHPGLGRHSPHARTAAPGPAPATPTPSGGPASWPRWLATPRAPPRPRGGENRAGERVPPLFVLEPTGPAGQRTKRTFFVPAGAEPCWYPRGAVWERVQRTQGRFTSFAYHQPPAVDIGYMIFPGFRFLGPQVTPRPNGGQIGRFCAP